MKLNNIQDKGAVKKVSKGNTQLLKWVVLTFIIIALCIGGFFGYKIYQEYLENKIYSTNENVGFPDFKINISKAEFKEVDLPLDKEAIAKYGPINNKENCDTQSKDSTYWKAWDGDIAAPWVKYGPSAYNICIRRNDSRDAIAKYSSENKQLVVNFTITATSNVEANDISIALEPDSGRKLSEQVNSFNANQFFPYGAQELLPQELLLGAPGPVYTTEKPQKYTPYHLSDLGGNINKGIVRNGNLYTDIRTSESSVDFKVAYHGQTRIIRITQ